MLLTNADKHNSQILVLSPEDMDFDAFAALLFRYSSEEDLELYSKAELKKAAQYAAQAILRHEPHKAQIEIIQDGVKKSDELLSVVTIINDNKPFLLDTLLNVLCEHELRISLLAHPIFTISPYEDGYKLSSIQACDIKRDSKVNINRTEQQAGLAGQLSSDGARRLSVIQFHLPYLSCERKEALIKAFNKALSHLYLAVEDWHPMLARVGATIDSYKKAAERKQIAQIVSNQIEDFLAWLCNDNFTFLGICQYRYDSEKPQESSPKGQGKGSFIPLDNKLGLLRDGEFSLFPHSDLLQLAANIGQLNGQDDVLRVRKVNIRSLVHRYVFLDCIDILLIDDRGEVCGALAILGLFTSSAYIGSIFTIPYLKAKAQMAIAQLGFCLEDYSGKALIDILETYPRDEIFHTDINSLEQNLSLLLKLSERPKIRVVTHFDPEGCFISVLVYLPKELYNTDNYKKIGQHLLKIYDGDHYDAHPLFVSHNLARIYFLIHKNEITSSISYPRALLEQDIISLTKDWHEALLASAQLDKIDEKYVSLAQNFPSYYQERFSPKDALEDAQHIAALRDDKSLIVHFYQQKGQREDIIGLKIFHAGSEIPLSQRIPLLENMGFRAISERSYGLPDGQGGRVYFHDMRLEIAFEKHAPMAEIGDSLAQAFIAIWARDADNDAFNGLVQSAELSWREIVILRAYGRYLQQAGNPYAQDRLAQALNTHPNIARLLYQLFELKFDPQKSPYNKATLCEQIEYKIDRALQTVPQLDDDLILRRFLNLIKATLRSNAFQLTKGGQYRRVLAFKLDPQQIEALPEPRPFREIFVYGPEVEGVHLRFGRIARGGIRWSDRALDYRTEILGLVKAQQVKNAVIVPVGSKGGFYPHNLPQNAERAQIQEAARQAYILYIEAMLSITDNILNGEVVHPQNILCYDDGDPYFVVAADKGTASFSDTANAISQAKDFWLDDAFASGGSAGYDHKALAITAKGAWEAVKRHFRELYDRDIHNESFTMIGIGDMSGDVFGNGLLLSRKTKLIAAFDHRDIFIDPDPDEELSYNERKRLFDMPRSSWQDYDRAKLSKGGGIYSRNQKTIALSPEAAKALSLSANMAKKEFTPYELMSAILRAKVDLLWFGGIGTYIRAQGESDAEVGDRANDRIRISAKEVRAAIIGEGANLGMTQRARIEYSLNGGRCDTDAIDNSGGVNCSDVEVNIKIALAQAMRQGKLQRSQRDELLHAMAGEVEDLVLKNNYLQPLALSLAEEEGSKALPYQSRFMQELERDNPLLRNVELLPLDSEVQDRMARGQGLSRAELAVLLAYGKLRIKEQLSHSQLIDNDYFYATLLDYFPKGMQSAFEREISEHPLRREIISTSIANDIVNRGGPSFVTQLQDKTNANLEDIICAYISVRDGFNLAALYQSIDALDNKIAGKIQNQLYGTLRKLLFDASEAALRSKGALAPNYDIANIKDRVANIHDICTIISQQYRDLLPYAMIVQFEEKAQEYQNLGLAEALAQALAMVIICPNIPHLELVIEQLKGPKPIIIKIYFDLLYRLGIEVMERASQNMAIFDYYDVIALNEARAKMAKTLQSLVNQIYHNYGGSDNPIAAWLAAGGEVLENSIGRLYVLLNHDFSISRFIVAASLLEDLSANRLAS